MKTAHLRVSTLMFLLCCAPPASAAATPEEAARLAKALEPYFGSAAADKSPIFSVAPKGDAGCDSKLCGVNSM